MAEDKRWWKRDKDSDTSKEDVEDLLNEAEAKRLQREEELAEACLLYTSDAADE